MSSTKTIQEGMDIAYKLEATPLVSSIATDGDSIKITDKDGVITELTIPLSSKATSDSDGNVIKDTYAAKVTAALLNGVLTIKLYSKSNNVISTGTANLPIKPGVISGHYDAATQSIILEMEDSSNISISLATMLTDLATTSYVDSSVQAEENRAIAVEATKLSKTTADATYVSDVKQGTSTINVTKNGTTTNITVPYSEKATGDASGNEIKKSYAADFTMSLDPSTYVLTIVMKAKDGTALATKSVDLPLETLVVSASYDAQTKSIVLLLENGQTISVPVGDLVAGLASTDYVNAQVIGEANRAKAAETVNSGKIDVLTTNLETETSRATTAETKNANSVLDEATRAKAAEKTNSDAISAETSRATTAEGNNATAISTETTRAKAAENVNTSAINDEASTARSAEQANATAISDETTRAKSVEDTKADKTYVDSGFVSAVEASTATLKVTKNGVNSFITVPYATQAMKDDSGNEIKKKYASTLTASLDTSTYKLTIALKSANGDTLSSAVVDFPSESVVVYGAYDDTSKSIILTLQNGSIVKIPVSDLIEGLASTTYVDSAVSDETSRATSAEATKADKSTTLSGYGITDAYTKADCNLKFQLQLVSGTSIKTVNGQSLLGSGDVPIVNGTSPIATTDETIAGASVAAVRISNKPVEVDYAKNDGNGNDIAGTYAKAIDLTTEVSRAKAAESTNATAISTETTRAEAAEATKTTKTYVDGAFVSNVATGETTLDITKSGTTTSVTIPFATKATDDDLGNGIRASYASDMTATMDSSTNILTLKLKSKTGEVLATQTVDLTISSVIVGATYDSTNQTLIFTLSNGQTLTVPLSDMLSGVATTVYVDAETARAKAAEQTVSNGLASEISRAKAAEASNATAISDEATRAKAAESTNATAISDEATRAKNAESANTTSITDETTRAKAAESTNATAISTETTRATNAETTNATSISDETTRAKAAEALKADKTYVDSTFVSGVTLGATTLNIGQNGSTTELTIPYAIKSKGDESGNDILTSYGASLDMTLDTTTYKLTIALISKSGATLTSKMVDFPMESVVVSGSYDATNKDIILTLQNGSTVTIPVDGLVNGLASTTYVDTSVSTEKTRAEAAESTNTTNIATNATAISDEATRAKAAEKTNSDAISAETTRAKAAESANATNIANEITRAKAAESTNSTAISTETSRAEAAESSLSSSKQNNLTFDTTPKADSTNPVQSKGIKSYVDTAIAGDMTGTAAKATADASGNDITTTYATKAEDEAKIPLSQKAASNGVATLDANKKLLTSQLPDTVSGQMLYSGTIDGSGVCSLSQSFIDKYSVSTLTIAKNVSNSYNGSYFIASAAGTMAAGEDATTYKAISYEVGDWIVGSGASGYFKIDNTDAVMGVTVTDKTGVTTSGPLGNVEVNATNIGLGNVDNTSDADKPVSNATEIELNKKVDKVAGSSLMTDAEHNKLSGIASGAEVNVNADWNATSGDAFINNKPTKLSQFTNDSGYALDSALSSEISARGTADSTLQTNIDTVNTKLSSYLLLSGGTMTGDLNVGNTTIFASGSNGGLNSIRVGDDTVLGDCNVGGHLGVKSANTMDAGFCFYNPQGEYLGDITFGGNACSIGLSGQKTINIPFSNGTLAIADSYDNAQILSATFKPTAHMRFYLSLEPFCKPSEDTDLRSIIYNVPFGVYIINAARDNPHLTTNLPIIDDAILEWMRVDPAGGAGIGSVYGVLRISSMLSPGKIWQCSVYNRIVFTQWNQIITSQNISSQSVASATKATNDDEGNRISTTYLSKSDASSTYMAKSSIDSVPTENSTNPVSSGGVYSALNPSMKLIQVSNLTIFEARKAKSIEYSADDGNQYKCMYDYTPAGVVLYYIDMHGQPYIISGTRSVYVFD